jgi:hypothetical protein
MARHNIDENFQAALPGWLRGVPNPPTIDAGVSSDSNNLSGTIAKATEQISQLQAAYQQQVALITANTQAIQGNTSAQSSRSAASTAGNIASGFLSGGGLLSPLISGIASLFGGSAQPAPLPVYLPPAPISINATLQSAMPTVSQSTGGPAMSPQTVSPASAPNAGRGIPTPQITVNVSAMDSQSFMDRSTDIANAVREAMLNLHPINDVVASL